MILFVPLSRSANHEQRHNQPQQEQQAIAAVVIERGGGERTAAIEVPEPGIFETQTQMLKEQAEIIKEINRLRGKLADLWLNPTHQID